MLGDVLVEPFLDELFVKKFDIEALVGMPACETCVEGECETVDGLVGCAEREHPGAWHLCLEVGVVDEVDGLACECLGEFVGIGYVCFACLDFHIHL